MTHPTDKSARGARAHKTGLDAEDAAVRLLEARGLTILERRYRSPYGEIDIIAISRKADGLPDPQIAPKQGQRDTETLIFVEVKARRTRDDAAHSLTARQWQRLENTAIHYCGIYLNDTNLPQVLPRQPQPDMRFDVILVGRTGDATWIENARRFDEW